MEQIQRYRADVGGDNTTWPIVVPDIEGQLCYYSDHKQRIVALEASNAELVGALEAFMQLPHLFDDVCEFPECKVCKAIVLGTETLARAEANRG